MKLVWKILIGLAAIFVAGFFGLMGLGFWHLGQLKKTADAVERINSYKITLADVNGTNLPPKPDQQLNDSTVAGIDANGNGIRDDVELAIFQKYPDSARTRAAELQYAQALQLELTQVFDSGTLVPIMQKRAYSQSCIDEVEKSIAAGNDIIKEVENLVFNTSTRANKQNEVFDKYMSTYAIPPKSQECDIDLSTLSD